MKFVKHSTFWLCVVVFTTSVLITLLFLVILPPQYSISEGSDYLEFYKPVAKNLIVGKGLVTAGGQVAIRYPPGYPLLLAGLFKLSSLLNFSEQTIVSLFTLSCFGLTSIFVFLLARTIWGNLGGIISSLIWMTYPFALWLTKEPNSESPFMVLFYWSFYLFWCALLQKSYAWYIYFFSGLLIGCAMLIRPIAIGMGLVMVIILWRVCRGVKGRVRLFLAIMLLSGILVAVLPWSGWVYSKTGKVVILSSGGVPSVRDGLTFAVKDKGYRVGAKVPPDVKLLMRDIDFQHNELKSIKDIASVIKEELYKRPSTVAKLFIIKAARCWYGTDSQRYEILIIPIQMVYLGVILWGTVLTWKSGDATKQLTVSVWLIVLLFWAMATLVLSILRYMVPIMGLLFLFIPGIFLRFHTRQT